LKTGILGLEQEQYKEKQKKEKNGPVRVYTTRKQKKKGPPPHTKKEKKNWLTSSSTGKKKVKDLGKIGIDPRPKCRALRKNDV